MIVEDDALGTSSITYRELADRTSRFAQLLRAMPVTVAVDSRGEAVHKTGPAQWRAKIGKIPVAVI